MKSILLFSAGLRWTWLQYESRPCTKQFDRMIDAPVAGGHALDRLSIRDVAQLVLAADLLCKRA